jgi:hypothetical protein
VKLGQEPEAFIGMRDFRYLRFSLTIDGTELADTIPFQIDGRRGRALGEGHAILVCMKGGCSDG